MSPPIHLSLDSAYTPALLGRDTLLADLATQLDHARLLTLVGPGGVGKTCVARELLRGRDAYWIDLAPFVDPAIVPQVIAVACELVEQRGQTWIETLIAALHERDTLLVLDTCEHLRATCAEVCTTLLRTCPHLNIVTTSRLPLSTSDEFLCVVPPLDADTAIALFVARARAHMPRFALTPETRPLVAAVCSRLDGMPLAIELAAARIPLLSVAQIAERLTNSLDLLAARDPDLPPRQRTLRATLDWSHALIDDAAQILLRRLSVFAGSFDLDAIEAVCQSSELLESSELWHVLDHLAQLVEASLVIVAARDETGAVRYQLHDVLRQYAADRLSEAGEVETLHARLLAWAVALAEHAESELRGPQQAVWLARLKLDHANLRVALREAESRRDAEPMLRLANALRPFWNTGLLNEGRSWLQRALHIAAGHTSPVTVKALNSESFLAYRQGDYTHMKSAADEALRQALQIEFDEGVAEAHYCLGIYAEMQEYLPQSREHYLTSLALYRELNQRRGIANTLNGLAHVARLEGKLAEARDYYEQGLALARAENDRRTLMLLLISLGNLLLDSEEPGSAEAPFAESLVHIWALDEITYLPYVANGLGEVARMRGDEAGAIRHYEEGLRHARALKLDDMAGQLVLKLGDLAAYAGDTVRAARDLGEGLQIYTQLERPMRVVIGMHLCAKFVYQLGYPAQAVTLFAAGLHLLATDNFGHVGDIDHDACTLAYASARAALTEIERESAIAAGQALTLPQAVELTLSSIHLPPRETSVKAPELQIFTFGALRVLRAGRELSAEDWVYGKTRELLLFLLHVDSADKETIASALWPDASPRQVKSNFRTAIYHLRRALGATEWIAFSDGRYAFNRTRDYWLDSEAFTNALAQAEREPARRAEHLGRATTLYRGDLALESIESEVLLVRREQLRQQAIDALLALGALRLEGEMFSPAAEVYRRVLALDSYLETAHRGLLRSLARQGERGEALAHYQTLVALLKSELGLDPAPETHALAEAITRGEM